MTTVLVVVMVFLVIGGLIGRFWPRLFPAYKRGTRVKVRFWPEQPAAVTGEYLYHNSATYHRVRVVSDSTGLWAPGRVLTVKAEDMDEIND